MLGPRALGIAAGHEDAMWGQHLILDLGECDRTAVRSVETIRAFCQELVAGIGMTAYGEPMLEHFAVHNPSAAGYTLVQLIETSNICAHFAEAAGEVYVDIFSCQPFSEDTAIDICRAYFAPRTISRTSLMRGAGRTTVHSSAA